jgi:hypothetical protein
MYSIHIQFTLSRTSSPQKNTSTLLTVQYSLSLSLSLTHTAVSQPDLFAYLLTRAVQYYSYVYWRVGTNDLRIKNIHKKNINTTRWKCRIFKRLVGYSPYRDWCSKDSVKMSRSGKDVGVQCPTKTKHYRSSCCVIAWHFNFKNAYL